MVRYKTVEDIPTTPMMRQGTVYDTPDQAKFAAAKVFCNCKGVAVKRVVAGWVVFWWR